MLRLLMSIGIGITLGAGIVSLVGPPGAGVWGLPVGLLLTIGCGVLTTIAHSVQGMQLPSSELVKAAESAGRLGISRVDALRQTGTRINEQPVCDVEITVQPGSGSAFRTVTRSIVPVTDLPRFQPGSRHVVALLAEGEPDISFIGDDPDAGRWAHVVVPPADAAGEIRRPQPGRLTASGTRRGPILGIGRRGRPLRIALFVVAAAVAATAVVLPYRTALAQTIAAIPGGRLHADLRLPDNLDSALDALAREIGHDSVVSVVVTEDLVVVEAPVTPGDPATDSWLYRRGAVDHQGAATIQPDSESEQFTLGEVAWDALWPAMHKARGQAEVPDPEESTFVVDRSAGSSVETGSSDGSIGPVEIVFSVENDYRSVWFRMNADGSGLEVTSES